MIACRSRTSAAARTNESATKSTPMPSAKSGRRDPSSSATGSGSGHPGRLTPLWELTSPPTTTRQRARPCSTSSTARRTRPSSIRMSWPGRSTSPITAGATGSSPSGGDLLADDEDLLVLDQEARRRQVADPQLRPLQVGDQRERLARLLLHLAHDLRPLGVILVGAVREVEADRVDAGVDERRGPRRGSTRRGRSSRRSSSCADQPPCRPAY